jgi:hypothetical protein
LLIPEITIRAKVLDACTYDVENDGRDELFILQPYGIHIYVYMDGELRETHVLKFSHSYISYTPQKNVLGKLCVFDLDGDSTPECYARSSRFRRGMRWIFQDGNFRLYDTFYGYPVGVDFNPEGRVLLLSKLAEGKDYFTGDLFFRYATDGKPRVLTNADGSIVAFYNFCSLLDIYNQNLIRLFLDLDYHLHFMTSGGGTVLQDNYFGVGMTIGDIDADNKPEIFVSSAALPGDPDHVSMFEIEDKELRLAWQSEWAEGSIYVLTMGDLDGNGRQDLITFRENSGTIISTTVQVLSQ